MDTQPMLDKARAVQQRAYAPYSKFLVGCCIRSGDDSYHVGCNVENASYGLTQYAEGSAISAMIVAGDKQINEVLIVGSGDGICPPCGACRQRIREFAAGSVPIHLCDDTGVVKTMTLAELLPESFGPDNLEHLR